MGVVEDERNQTAGLVWRHGGRTAAAPNRGSLGGGGNCDRFEDRNRLRLAVLEHREIGGAQTGDGTPLLVEHGDVELDDVNAGAELLRLLKARP